MGAGKRVKRTHYPPHPCWRCQRETTRYALCDPCYRNPPQGEERGWGDYTEFIDLLNKYQDAAQLRIKAKVKHWSRKDHDQKKLKAILEG